MDTTPDATIEAAAKASPRSAQYGPVAEKVISSQPVKSFARQARREIGNQILRSPFGTRSR